MVDDGLDLFGRRILGWIGGAALLTGLGLFLALAVSHGWIDPLGRVILAGAASVALMAAGTWLFESHGRTEAAAIAVGVATAGQWATLAVAVDLYRVVPAMLGVVIALATASAATLIAVRWAGRPVAALGLLGGLLAPLALGVAEHTAAIAILGLAEAAVLAVTVWQRWRWLSVAAVAVCVPQWLLWLGHGPSVALQFVGVSGFIALGLAAAVATGRRRGQPGLEIPAAVLAALTALSAGAAMVGVWVSVGRPAAGAWLAAVAVAFALCGRRGPHDPHDLHEPRESQGRRAPRTRRTPRRLHTPEPLAAILTALAVMLVDGALALLLSGVWLTAAWGASALAAAWLVRRDGDGTLAQLGLGGHVGLTLLRAAQASVTAGRGDAETIVSLAILAGFCLAAGSTVRAREWSILLHGLGLVAGAYLAAQALSGAPLVAAWCAEAAALAAWHRRTPDPFALVAGLGFLALAVAHTVRVEAPPSSLVLGAGHLGATALALSAITLACLGLGAATRTPNWRHALIAGALASALYLGSVALITVFQPAAAAVTDMVLDLGVRQQGQVLLSGAWSLIGVLALAAGLRLDRLALRAGGLGILLLAAGKVTLYDLSTLTSIYRVLSLAGIGVLCLVGAFVYQRLRPGPLPDLRATAPVAR